MTKAPTQKPPKRERIEKAELFAYAYIRNMGNGTKAAMEVYGTEAETASVQASGLLRNPKVQKIVGTFLDAQRDSLKKFTEQGSMLYTVAVQALIEILSDKDTSVRDKFEAIEKLMRIGGFEISSDVTIAKINAKSAGDVARTRAILPGLPGPGQQPGTPQLQQNNDNRRVLFLLQPPPIPPGGVPTPALLQQWKEMYAELGFVPGIDLPEPKAENTANGKPHSGNRPRARGK